MAWMMKNNLIIEIVYSFGQRAGLTIYIVLLSKFKDCILERY